MRGATFRHELIIIAFQNSVLKDAQLVRYLTGRNQMALLIDRSYYLTSHKLRRSPSRLG